MGEGSNSPMTNKDESGLSSKQERLDRLSQCAIEMFAQHGYEGTSLREIATMAHVPLSMIDRYFGSKMDLFNEVQHHVWKEVNIDREARLQSPISTKDDGTPTLESVLYALIYPVVSRAVGDEHQAPMVRLLRENTSMRVHMGMKRGPKRALLAEDWLLVLMKACPQLDQAQAVWALSFVISTMYCGQLLDGWLDDLMPEDGARNAEGITRLMVDFCENGIVAVAKKS